MLDFASGQTAVAISLLGGLLGLAAAALVALTRGRRLRPATSEAPVGQPSRATAPEVPTVYVSQAASVYTETQERLRSRYLESKLASGDSHSSTSQKDLVQELERIGRVATLQPGQRALEVGCGLGVWTMHLARQGFKAYGLDLDPDFVEEGRKQAARQGVDAHFVAAPAEKLPFDDGYFDVVISSFVLEHVADWRVMLREMLRVLRPGGVAYLSTNCVFYPFTNEVRLPLFPLLPGMAEEKAAQAGDRALPVLGQLHANPRVQLVHARRAQASLLGCWVRRGLRRIRSSSPWRAIRKATGGQVHPADRQASQVPTRLHSHRHPWPSSLRGQRIGRHQRSWHAPEIEKGRPGSG